MKVKNFKQHLAAVKQWLFEYIFIVDAARVTNPYFVFLMTLLELALFQFYYISPSLTFLRNYELIKSYQDSFMQYIVPIVPFTNEILSLLILLLYPLVMCVALLIKKVGLLRPLVLIVQLTTYCYPLLVIKIVLETLVCFKANYLLFLVVPLSLLSLLFGAVVLILSGRLHRYIEIPIIVSLYLQGNEVAILVLLVLRLIVLYYLFRTRRQFMISFYAETAMLLVALSCLFCEDQVLNYIGFIIISVSFFLFGLFSAKLYFEGRRNIYDKVDELEENPETAFDEVIADIEEHETDCAWVSCKCHAYIDCDRKKLKEFVLSYEEQRLKRKVDFADKVHYAEVCAEKYEFKLCGLLHVCEHVPENLWEEYQYMRVCQLFENNMRKQDKNYKHGEAYLCVSEEEQSLSEDMLEILTMVKQFWALITSFDGSTKFLALILKISAAINRLEETYNRLHLKYDEEFTNFKYLMDLFRTLILNEKVSEEDEVALPEAVTYIITSGPRIISANNNFALLVNRNLEHIRDTPFQNYIPEVYREPHRLWTEEFVEHYEKYE